MKKVMCAGHSICKGESTQGNWRQRVKLEAAANSVSFDYVGSQTTFSSGMDDPQHEGYDGAATADTTSNIVTKGSYAPDVVILMVGINDLLYGTSVSSTKALINSCLAACYSTFGNAVQVYICDVLPAFSPYAGLGGVPGDIATRITSLNTEIGNLCATYTASGKWCKRIACWSAFQSGDFFDGVHPTTSGYTALGDQVWAVVKQSFDGQSPTPSPTGTFPFHLHAGGWDALNSLQAGVNCLSATGCNSTMVMSGFGDLAYLGNYFAKIVEQGFRWWLEFGGPVSRQRANDVVAYVKQNAGAYALMQGVKLPDEPELYNYSPAALNDICLGVRDAGCVKPIVLNTTGRTWTQGGFNYTALSYSSVAWNIWAFDMYLDCTPSCGWCNTLADIRGSANAIKAEYDRLGYRPSQGRVLGFMGQGFNFVGCSQTTWSAQTLKDCIDAVAAIYNTDGIQRFHYVGAYAWLDNQNVGGGNVQQHAKNNSWVADELKKVATYIVGKGWEAQFPLDGGAATPSTPTTPPVYTMPVGLYYFVNQTSGRYNLKAVSGSAVQWTGSAESSGATAWRVALTSVADAFTLQNYSNGKYLSMSGSTVSLVSTATSDNERWIAYQDGDFFGLKNKATGLWVDTDPSNVIKGGSATPPLDDGKRWARTASPLDSSTTPGNGDGLNAVYYDNVDFTGTKYSYYVSNVNFDWSAAPPDPSMARDFWSARFTGWIQAPATGTFTFKTISDDGVRVWIDGRLLSDHWVDQSATAYTFTKDLVAGQRYAIRIEYFNSYAGGSLKLLWSTATMPETIVPQSALFRDGGSSGSDPDARMSPANPTLSVGSGTVAQLLQSHYYIADVWSLDTRISTVIWLSSTAIAVQGVAVGTTTVKVKTTGDNVINMTVTVVASTTPLPAILYSALKIGGHVTGQLNVSQGLRANMQIGARIAAVLNSLLPISLAASMNVGGHLVGTLTVGGPPAGVALNANLQIGTYVSATLPSPQTNKARMRTRGVEVIFEDWK